MVKGGIDSEIGNPLQPFHGLIFSITARDFLYAISHKQDNSSGALAGRERKPMIGPPRRLDPTTEAHQASVFSIELNTTSGFHG